MERKYRVLSLTNVILEYRIPVYNQLSAYFDVTVAHHGKPVNSIKAKFKQIQLNPKKIGPFIGFKENISELAKQYDAVIALGDLHYLPFFKLSFLKNRKFALSYWSIGVSASYGKRFDEDRRLDKIRFKLMDRADSLIFYTPYPIDRYVNDGGVEKKKLFVANNTVEVKEKIEIPKVKNHFLFVGTLYKAKKIFDLLEAYKIAYLKNNQINQLIVVGDGEEYNNIVEWVHGNGLDSKITLTGSIFDQNELKEYYKNAIACLSPGQAGLTVLNSMAYGVPFVTTDNAITGGEIFNIDNGINGITYNESTDNLADIIVELSSNKEKVYELSKNAQDYYFKNRTMDIMVDGIRNAVHFAISSKR